MFRLEMNFQCDSNLYKVILIRRKDATWFTKRQGFSLRLLGIDSFRLCGPSNISAHQYANWNEMDQAEIVGSTFVMKGNQAAGIFEFF